MPRRMVSRGGETVPRGTVAEVSVKESGVLRTVNVDSRRVAFSFNPKESPFREAIVRIVPGVDARDEDVEHVRREVEAGGPLKVVVVPRPKGSAVPGAFHVEPVAPVGLRQAVEEVVEASSSADKAALRDLAERIMSEVGL